MIGNWKNDNFRKDCEFWTENWASPQCVISKVETWEEISSTNYYSAIYLSYLLIYHSTEIIGQKNLMMIAKIQFGEDVFPSLLLGKSSILISPFVTFTSSSKRTLGDIFPTYLHLKRRIAAGSGSILPFLLCVQYGLTRIFEGRKTRGTYLSQSIIDMV